MTNSQWHGGKGSGRRKGADDAKYRESWERIFGKRDNSKSQGNTNKGRSTKPTQE